jgi:DNA-directed RNA polymerase subunit E'/Rpb7
MATTTTITTKVYLKPHELTDQYKTLIWNRLNEQLCGSCTKQYGYVLDIQKINKIYNNIIKSNCKVFEDKVVSQCDTIFEIVADVILFKPIIGKIYKAEVICVLQIGFTVLVHNKLKVLIQNISDKYTFCQEKRSFINKEDNSQNQENEIKRGSIVNIQILGLKYIDKNYVAHGIMV